MALAVSDGLKARFEGAEYEQSVMQAASLLEVRRVRQGLAQE